MNDDNVENTQVDQLDKDQVDENMNLFIYGNILIRDIKTGEVLVNQRF